LRARVPQDHRPPRADVIQVAVAVRILQSRALRLPNEERIAAHGAERAHGAVDAAGNQLDRAPVQRAGLLVCAHFRNQRAISLAAVSAESEPCTRFSCTSRAKSARMEPGADSSGRVAPIICRAAATALSPSR